MRLRFLVLLSALFCALPVLAQNTITVTPSTTSGDGTITTVVTWSTNPALPTGTPCMGTNGPAAWNVAKAGSGTQTLTISQSGTITLGMTCQFPGDSIVQYTWTPPTQNTDGSNYTNRDIIRLKQTFNATLTSGPACGTGETCVDVDDSGATRPTMRTITGITQTGTLRGTAYARNSLGIYSAPTNVVTKTFTGSVPVTVSAVPIVINPVPGTFNLSAQ